MSNKKYQYPAIQDPNTVGFAALGAAIISIFFFPLYTGTIAIVMGGWGTYLGVKAKSKKCLVLSLISAIIGIVVISYYISRIGA